MKDVIKTIPCRKCGHRWRYEHCDGWLECMDCGDETNKKLGVVMNLNELATLVVAREGKKKSVNIAQVKEILGIVADMLVDVEVQILMLRYGMRRKKK